MKGKHRAIFPQTEDEKGHFNSVRAYNDAQRFLESLIVRGVTDLAIQGSTDYDGYAIEVVWNEAPTK